MSACKNCGAEASGIACEFCGAIQRQPQGPDEEMQALKSIAEAAQRFMEKKSEARFSTDGDVQRALANFWRTAWLPTTPDALHYCASAALAALPKPSGKQIEGNAPVQELYTATYGRARAAVDAFAQRAPTDHRWQPIRNTLDTHEREHEARRKSYVLTKRVTQVLLVLAIVTPCVAFWQFRQGNIERAEKAEAARAAEIDEKTPLASVPEAMRGTWKGANRVELLITANSASLPKAGLAATCDPPLDQFGSLSGDCSGDGRSSFTIPSNIRHMERCGLALMLGDDGKLIVTASKPKYDPHDEIPCAKFNGTFSR